jgi:hypothetical protein
MDLPDLSLKSEFRYEFAVRVKATDRLVPITRARAIQFIAAGPTEGPHVELVTREVRILVSDWDLYEDPGQCERMRDALKLIDAHGCENNTEGRCWDDGRTPGAKYDADAWCNACVAADALRALPPSD